MRTTMKDAWQRAGRVAAAFGMLAFIAVAIVPAFPATYAFAQSKGGSADLPAGQASSNDPTIQDPAGSIAPVKSSFQLVSCTPEYDPMNPRVLKNDCTYEELIKTAERVLSFAMFIIVPIMVGMLVYSGFKYMNAGGDVNLMADAKRMFVPIVIGMFFIFGAWLIVHTILAQLLANQIGTITKTSIIGQ